MAFWIVRGNKLLPRSNRIAEADISPEPVSGSDSDRLRAAIQTHPAKRATKAAMHL